MRLELEPESPGFQPRVLPLFYIKTEVLELLVSKSFNVMIWKLHMHARPLLDSVKKDSPVKLLSAGNL